MVKGCVLSVMRATELRKELDIAIETFGDMEVELLTVVAGSFSRVGAARVRIVLNGLVYVIEEEGAMQGGEAGRKEGNG